MDLTPSPLYPALAENCAKIDQRRVVYQYDLQSLPWSDVGLPGEYATRSLLRDFGLDFQLPRHGEELFQWAFAVSICDHFIGLEDGLINFITAPEHGVVPTKSSMLLVDEEAKHVATLEKYKAYLMSLRPEWRDGMQQVIGRSLVKNMPFRNPDKFANARMHHYLSWQTALFFEEFTIYLDEKLQDGNPQPAWSAVHHAHRKEEEQHVVTDRAYLQSLELSDEDEREGCRQFSIFLVSSFLKVTGFATALEMVDFVYPELQLSRKRLPLRRTPLFEEIVHGRWYRRTMEAAPCLFTE